MIGIIGALDVEVQGFIDKMEDTSERIISKIKFTVGKIENRACVVAQCGIGKVNAAMCAQTMILSFKLDYIINSGVAGALSPKLSIGDIVISKDVVQHDIDLIEEDGGCSGMVLPRGTIEFSDEKILHIPADGLLIEKLNTACGSLEDIHCLCGTIATGEQFISSRVKRLEIGTYFNALACEMEGAAIGQVCYRNEVPFVVLRSISDCTDSNEYMDFLEFKDIAAENAIRAISKMIRLM